MTKILVVEHEADAGLGLLGERFAEIGVETVVVGPDAGLPVPESLDGYDGLVVLGGAMGPTDDEVAPWLPATRQLLATAVDQSVPALGICLGAQLLATATGGHVRRIPEAPEVGLLTVQLNEAAATDPLLGGFEHAELPVVQWHWLEADRLPEGAELLASSPACRNQAFRLGSHAWGLQFHPEALGDTAQAWTSVEDLTADGLDPATVVRGVREAEPQLRDAWRTLADRFTRIAESQSVAQAAGEVAEPAQAPA